jgi:hypothetical protein
MCIITTIDLWCGCTEHHPTNCGCYTYLRPERCTIYYQLQNLRIHERSNVAHRITFKAEAQSMAKLCSSCEQREEKRRLGTTDDGEKKEDRCLMWRLGVGFGSGKVGLDRGE